MVNQFKNQGGFSLIEIVVAIGLLAIVTGSIIPVLSRVEEGEKVARTRAELENIRVALEEYWYDKRTFVSAAAWGSLDSTPVFKTKYITTNFDDSTLRDEFSPTNDYYRYTYNVLSMPYTALVWSVGPDGVDDTRTNDDIWVIVYSEVPGRRKTRVLLNIIARAQAKYIKDYGILTTAWTTTSRAGYGLGTEFDYDGFRTTLAFVNSGTTTYLIYSRGPNGILNTLPTSTSVGTGDDMRH